MRHVYHQVTVDQWMYEISPDTAADNPTAAWRKCWDLLGDHKAAAAAGVAGRYGAALECLRQYAEAHPLDPVAPWLQGAVKWRWAAPADFPTAATTWGKLPVLMHYGAPPPPKSDGRRESACSSTSQSSRTSGSTSTGPSTAGPLRGSPMLSRHSSTPGFRTAVRGASSSTRLRADLKMFRTLSDNIRMLLASGSDAVVVIDVEETIHYWNAKAEVLFGCVLWMCRRCGRARRAGGAPCPFQLFSPQPGWGRVRAGARENLRAAEAKRKWNQSRSPGATCISSKFSTRRRRRARKRASDGPCSGQF